MPPKKSKNKCPTGQMNTGPSQGGAAAGGGNTNPADVVAFPSDGTAKPPPTGCGLGQGRAASTAGENYESDAHVTSGSNDFHTAVRDLSLNEKLPTGCELSQDRAASTAGKNYESDAHVASGGNDFSPDDSWMYAETGINVPTPSPIFKRFSNPSVKEDNGSNFKGIPVEIPDPPSVFVGPDLRFRVEAIIRNSGIVEHLLDPNPKTKKEKGKDPKRLVFSLPKFNFVVRIQDVLKIMLKWLDVSSVPQNSLTMLGELFPQTVSFDTLLSFRKDVFVSHAEKMDISFILDLMKSLDEKDRFEALKQLVHHHVLRQREAEPKQNWSYGTFLMEVLDQINKGHLWKADDVRADKSCIGGFVVSSNDEKNVSTSDLTIKELNEIALKILKSAVKKHKNDEDCKSLILLVCAIFRRIFPRSKEFPAVPQDLFWELLNVCNKTGIDEDLTQNCFTSKLDYDLMMKKVLVGSGAKPQHLSKLDGSGSKDLLSCSVLLGELMKDNRLVVDCSGTGTGKSLNWLIALIFRLLMLLISETNDAKSKEDDKSKGSKKAVAKRSVASVLLVGPLNGSSAFLARVVCRAVEVILRDNGLDVNIISVDNAIVPRKTTEAHTIQVFSLTSLDVMSAIKANVDENHPFVVMIDDSPVNLKHVLPLLMSSSTIRKVVVCGASIVPTTIDAALLPIIRGNDTTKTLSMISSPHHICHDVPMTTEQMKEVQNVVNIALFFYTDNMVYLNLLSNVLQSNLENFVLKGKLMTLVHDFLLRLFPTQVEGSFRMTDESDDVFLRKFLRHFTKLYILLMLKTRFKRDVVEDEYKTFLESGENCNVFEVADRFSVILKEYLDKMNVFIFREAIPALPSGIMEMSETLNLNDSCQKLVSDVTKAGFVLPESLDFPKPVLFHNEERFRNLLQQSDSGCRFLMFDQSLDPIEIARLVERAFLSVYGKIKTAEEKEQEATDHKQRKNGAKVLGSNSRKNSKTHNEGVTKKPTSNGQSDNRRMNVPASPDKEPEEDTQEKKQESPDNEQMDAQDNEVGKLPTVNENIDMTSSIEDQIKELMAAAIKVSKSLSLSAPIPNHAELKVFIDYLVGMRSPISLTIVKLFASGIFIPMPEMPFEMLNLGISIIEQGRLIFLVQEGIEAWDMRSQNFQFRHNVFVFFLSEVSSDFFLQNCLGRFGRMYQEFRVYVTCMTSSGRIVDKNVVPAPIVKAQGLSPTFDGNCLDGMLMSKIDQFVSGCFSLSDNCLSFLGEFLKVFSHALYDPEFKYATYAKSYDEFFRFLCCYLSSRFCGLQVSGTIDGSLDGFLTDLAVTAKSRSVFVCLGTQTTYDQVVQRFLDKISCLLDPSSVHIAASLCCAIKNRVFPGFNDSLLMSVFFNLKELVKFADLLGVFLRNLYSSSFTPSNGNDEIRPMITFLAFLRTTMEELSSLIASRVEEGKFLKALAEKRRLGFLKAPEQKSPIECLKQMLLSSPQSISGYVSIIQSAASDAEECRGFLRELNERLKSFGQNSTMLYLHNDLVKRLPEIDSSDQEYHKSISRLDATESEMNDKVSTAKKNADDAKKPSRIMSTSAQLKQLMEEAESLKNQNDVSREKFSHLLKMNERRRHDMLGQIEECKSSLRKYGSLSEAEFLDLFLKEIFS